MAKKKKELTDAEFEELDRYLENKFNYNIYEQLKGESYELDADYNAVYETWCENLYQPLDFFRLFSQQISFIVENKGKPLLIARTLRNLNLSETQLYFLYKNLLSYFRNKSEKDEKLEVSCREIQKLLNHLEVFEDEEDEEDEEDKTTLTKTKDEFQELLEHLETLPSYKKQITYLIKEKTKSEQNQSGLDWNFDNEKTFAEKCELEINKLRELMNLEESQNNSQDHIKRHKDLTLDRATLLFNYLFTYAKANCHNTKKAEVISFLTGYSENTIGDKLSALHSKADKNFIDYEKDMKIVRKYFENLGLFEIVEMINRDLKI